MSACTKTTFSKGLIVQVTNIVRVRVIIDITEKQP